MQKVSDCVSYLLIQVMKAHRRHAEPALNALGLHVGQEMILFRLWENDGITQSELAGCLCVEAPTITKMLQRMEATGLIERRPDLQDARVSRVYLTPKSRDLEGPVRSLWQDLEDKTLQGLSEAEIMLLRRLLLQIHENLTDDNV